MGESYMRMTKLETTLEGRFQIIPEDIDKILRGDTCRFIIQGRIKDFNTIQGKTSFEIDTDSIKIEVV